MTGQHNEYTTVRENGWKITFGRSDNSTGLRDAVSEMIGNNSPHPKNCMGIHSSKHTRVGKFTVNGRWYIFKDYLKRQAAEYLKASVIGSRVRKAWGSGRRLVAHGIGTPAVRAYGEKISFCIPTRNFLITDYLPDACGIHTFFSSFPFNTSDRETVLRKRAIIRDLGFFIGGL